MQEYGAAVRVLFRSLQNLRDKNANALLPRLRLDRSDILASKLLVDLMDSLDESRRHIGCCLGLGFDRGFRLPTATCPLLQALDSKLAHGHGLDLGIRGASFVQIRPDLRFSLLPVLNCCTVFAASLLVEFVSPLRDLRGQIS
jgi:hypothetical protein